METNKTKGLLFKVVHWLVVCILIVTLALLVECVGFQFHALRYKEKPITFSFTEKDDHFAETEKLVELSEEEINAIEVERENQKMLAEYYGTEYEPQEDETLVEKDDTMYRRVNAITLQVGFEKPYYIHKLDLRLPVTANCGYSAKLYLNDTLINDDIYCSVEPKTGAGICNISQRADALTIEILSSDEIKPQDITLTVSNNFSLNKMRIAFMIIFMALAVILYAEKKLISDKPEWMFAIVCFVLGLLLICGIGTNQVSYDEHVHAKAAYKLSFGTTIESTETAIQMNGHLLPYFNNPEERKLVEAYEDTNHDYSWADIGHQSRFVRTETRVYYPMAAGFWVGRKLGLGFATTVALAKLGNLLFYIFVVFWAIKLAIRHKYLVALIGLLPNSVFLAASISYDPMVNSFLLLGWVLILNEILEPGKKMTWQNLLLILISFFIGCQSKPIYIVMALMIVFFGKKKFENPVQEWILKISVVVMAGLMLYNIFRPTPAAGSDYYLVGNFDFAGDKRNVGTSVTGQISYILSNPVSYTLLLFRSMYSMLIDYIDFEVDFFQYGYLGTCSTVFTYLVIVLAVWLALFSPKHTEKCKILAKYIVLNLIMILGMSAVIWSSMYVSYTAVGAPKISGVQGRYFIPLFLACFSCLYNDRLESRLGKVGRGRIMFAVMAGINMLMIWTLVIMKLNI